MRSTWPASSTRYVLAHEILKEVTDYASAALDDDVAILAIEGTDDDAPAA